MPLALLQPATIRKRLTQAAVALLLLVGTFVAGNSVVSPEKSVGRTMLGHDFMAFYSAGQLVRIDAIDKLYDLTTIQQSETIIATRFNLEVGKGFGPYWNPPFYALYLAQFARLPYPRALAAWTVTNLICLAVAVMLLARMLPALIVKPKTIADAEMLAPTYRRQKRNGLLLAALLISSMPFIQALSHGQNTFCSFLILSAAVGAWRKSRPVLAGLIIGLLLYKPQLAAVVAGMMVLSLGLRVCLGLGFTAAVLTGITAIFLPGTMHEFITQLPGNLHFMQVEHAYLWERHVTLKAFWRLLLQGREAGEPMLAVTVFSYASMAAVGGLLLRAWNRVRTLGPDDVWTGQTRAAARDRLIGATILSMPLLMPFYFDYDLLLLAVPATLFAGELLVRPIGQPLDRSQRWTLGTWVALYGWLILNPPLAGLTHVNLSVILLSLLSGLSIRRAADAGVRTADLPQRTITPVTVRRAA